MMKLLAHLEKNRLFWTLLGLCILFFFLRLPSIIEPYWYGDEGIYQVIGQALNNGHLLYRDIWDNKPPLLYLIYAFAHSDQATVRTLSLIVGLLSVMIFFALSFTLFRSRKISAITTGVFVILFATPFWEGNIANAENFILLPIMTAAILIIRKRLDHSEESIKKIQKSLFFAGLLIGIAFLFKIVAIFDLAAFSLFLVLISLPKVHSRHLKQALRTVLILWAGFLIPFAIATAYFASQNILTEYLQAVFRGNVDYVGFENALYGIPQGLLILKVFLLLLAIIIVLRNRKIFTHTSLFITLWVVFALFNANFSGRPYTHYVLVLLPSFCLLLGLAVQKSSRMRKRAAWIGVIALTTLVLLTFPTFGVGRTFAYYQNTLLFLTNQSDLREYQSFFDPETPRDYAIASFIKSHSKQEDNVFIWGDSAQIYTLSNKLPPYEYTVAYHVKDNPELIRRTQDVINKAQPKYIIVLPESQPLPFSVPLYIIRFNVEGAIVYERSI